jgi:hypothetical protein
MTTKFTVGKLVKPLGPLKLSIDAMDELDFGRHVFGVIIERAYTAYDPRYNKWAVLFCGEDKPRIVEQGALVVID